MDKQKCLASAKKRIQLYWENHFRGGRQPLKKGHSCILVTRDFKIRRYQSRAQKFFLGFTEDNWGKGIPLDNMVPSSEELYRLKPVP